MRVDCHVHSRNSSDGKDPIAVVVAEALDKRLDYLALTDHLDLELKYGGNRTPIPWRHIDLDAYFAEWTAAKAALPADSGLELRFGIEVGYGAGANGYYAEALPKYPFDVVINSVHCVFGWDVYFPNSFLFRRKKTVYGAYLDAVAESLDAPYDYNVVAHLGYVTRNAPYADKSLRYEDFPDKFDKILLGIIDKGKALEVNTHTSLYPSEELLRKYYEYGGRKISFGSDSHRGELAKDYEATCALLRNIGFTDFSVFRNRTEFLMPIPTE